MRKYTIYPDLHISHIFPSIYFKKDSLKFDFSFNSNCKYNLNSAHNSDINKLYGFSFGLIHNSVNWIGKIFKSRANSFRIGWSCEKQNGKIQLASYYYNRGIRSTSYLCDVDVNKIYTAIINFDRESNKIAVEILERTTLLDSDSYDFDFSKCPKFGFRLYPYFGGTICSPQKMDIYIEEC